MEKNKLHEITVRDKERGDPGCDSGDDSKPAGGRPWPQWEGKEVVSGDASPTASPFWALASSDSDEDREEPEPLSSDRVE